MSVGELLKAARKRKGFSVDYVAEALGFTESMWYKIESGVRSLSYEFIRPVCYLLDISYPDMLAAMNIPMIHAVDACDNGAVVICELDDPDPDRIWTRRPPRIIGSCADRNMQQLVANYLALPVQHEDVNHIMSAMITSRVRRSLDR